MQLQSRYTKTIRRISLTPLADLVFILLVFFILETSFTEFREQIFNVPEARQDSESAGELLDLQLFADGKLWIQGNVMELAALGDYVDSRNFSPETAVVIKVQNAVSLQLLVAAMDALQSRKLEKIRVLPLSSP